MNEQEQFWSGEFGNEYTQRNRVDWRKRIPFWKYIIELTGIRSVFEFGCNAGWNLSAIRRLYPDIRLKGRDINRNAVKQAQNLGLSVYLDYEDIFQYTHEFVFTAGVLIHVAPENLKETMQCLVNLSCDYVLAIEYESEQEEMIEYRGYQNKLWKRPYGKLYQEMGLTLIESGSAGEGFDNGRCMYWLLRKP